MTALTNPEAAPLDKAAVEAFGERLTGTISEASLALMLSIGHRTGLFDTMATLPASTPQQIADATGLNERYVREWLGALVTGKMVEYDPTGQTYRLPAEHAALLTRDSELGNFAATMQWIGVLAGVEDKVIDKFRHGGGVHYHEFHRFHETMAEESAMTVVAVLREHILPLVPGLIEKLEDGVDVLDVGCGSGRAMCAMAEWFPNSRFMGFDLCEPAIDAARAEARDKGLTNVIFEVRDVTDLAGAGPFDLITGFDVVHDQRDPAGVLDAIHAAIKPDGTFLMQDIRSSSYVERNIDNPIAPLLYTISTMHCMTVSLAQDGAGLGTCWGEELALRMLDNAGFRDVEVNTFDFDTMNNWYTMTKT